MGQCKSVHMGAGAMMLAAGPRSRNGAWGTACHQTIKAAPKRICATDSARETAGECVPTTGRELGLQLFFHFKVKYEEQSSNTANTAVTQKNTGIRTEGTESRAGTIACAGSGLRSAITTSTTRRTISAPTAAMRNMSQ